MSIQLELGKGLATRFLSSPFTYWVTGVFIGYRMRDKMPRWLKKTLAVVTILSLLPVGVAMVSGVGSIKLQPKETRMLAKVEMGSPSARVPLPPPPFEILKRLREEEGSRAKQEAEAKAQPKQEPKQEVKAKPDKSDDGYVTFDNRSFTVATSNSATIGSATIVFGSSGGGTVAISSPSDERQKAGTRKGPFCRITCLVHHGDSYDVETDKEYCEKKSIPSDAEYIPGWVQQGEYEYRNPWPGPAGGGFDSYQLYWK